MEPHYDHAAAVGAEKNYVDIVGHLAAAETEQSNEDIPGATSGLIGLGSRIIRYVFKFICDKFICGKFWKVQLSATTF